MGWKDIIKSDVERQRELKLKQRRLERDAQKGIEQLGESIRGYESQRGELWNRAVQFQMTGNREEARKLVLQHKMKGVAVERLTRQKMVCENKLMQIATASAIGQVATSIDEFAKSLNIDSLALEDRLDSINGMIDNADEIADLLNKEAARDAEKADVEAGRAKVSNIDDEMAALEREAAARVANGSVATAANPASVSATADYDDMAASLKRLDERAAKLKQ